VKKYLLITKVFPPKAGGGVPRLTNFALRMKNYGWEASVVTTSVKDGWLDKEKEKLLDGIRIQRMGEYNRGKRKVYQKIIGRLTPIDAHFGWALQVWKHLKSQDLSEYDLILTSGPPHSVHYVGAKASKQFGIKWIADFRDHLTLAPKYSVYSPINAWLDRQYEKAIHHRADFIITNTRINRRDILNAFPQTDSKKLKTIYNGFEPSELACTRKHSLWSTLPEKQFNYCYTGGMYGPHIDNYFFNGLKKAIEINPAIQNEMSIRIFGDIRKAHSTVKPFLESGILTLHDLIPANQVGNVLGFADGGLCWQAGDKRDRGTIPQKFFEYLGSRTPVFSVGRPDGEIGNLCRRYGIGISVEPNSATHVARAFLRFHELVKKQKLNYSKCPDKIFDKFKRENQAKDLANLFQRTTGENLTP